MKPGLNYLPINTAPDHVRKEHPPTYSKKYFKPASCRKLGGRVGDESTDILPEQRCWYPIPVANDTRCRLCRIVFSSTGAVYGNADSKDNPINPYGASKWMIERILTELPNCL
jgi:hypothetical protein